MNLTQRFLANQPWKNPHGENQSERGEIFIISSAMYRTENGEKKTTYLHQQTLSQSLEMCAANQPYTLQYFCAKLNADRTTQKNSYQQQ